LKEICKYNAKLEEYPIIQLTEFTSESLIEFREKLSNITSNPVFKQAIIEVSSMGGEVYMLFSMIDYIANSPIPIHIVGSGIVASAAGCLLASNKKGFRWISPNSIMHIHSVQAGTQGSTPLITTETEHLVELNDMFLGHITKNSNMSIQELKNILKEKNGEWNFSAQEALEHGFVDYVGLPKLETFVCCNIVN